ncbi:MAG: glycoside hydrolase family 88 protein [Lachnospiraceae bacterium]|nr:glycoside hydrolase family 88 protein [Lachnospiraceae bacterium]
MEINKIDSYISEFLNHYQDYQTYWNYEDGCVLMGCKQMYEVTGDEKFYEYLIHYLRSRITEDGNIPSFSTEQFSIDSYNCGKVLFYAYEKEKDERYKKALDFHMDMISKHPRCQCGNFWHKEIYPNQIWLDGLYMAQPLYMEYETKYNKDAHYNDILSQFRNVRKYLFQPEKGLFYHAYDEARIQPWADKVTGCSQNFWSRAEGWWLMALVDTIEAMSPEIYEQYRELINLYKEAIQGILGYCDKRTGMIYQVIDKPEIEGNYLETSGSAMTAYAIMKGCRLGILCEEKYRRIGRELFENLCDEKLKTDADGNMSLTGICKVAGLGPGDKRNGSVEYYLSEPVVADDAKGVGPFMMAYAEYLKSEQDQ